MHLTHTMPQAFKTVPGIIFVFFINFLMTLESIHITKNKGLSINTKIFIKTLPQILYIKL